MKPKIFLALISSIGVFSTFTKPAISNEILIAHAEVKKIVTVEFKPTKTKRIVKKRVLPNGRIKKIITYVQLCRRIRTVKNYNGTFLKKRVKRNVECPDVSLYKQKKIFSNHKSVVKSPNHTHYQAPKVVNPIAPYPTKKVDDNSCREGSVIGGLLGAGITMSATRGKDRWWAVPAGGTAGALIGCQIDGG